MNNASREFLADLAKDFYESYAKTMPIAERFKMLWPLYAALGAGYIYVGTNFPHYGSDGNIALFYVPFVTGLITFSTAIGFVLFTMFWLNESAILGDPLSYKENLEKIDNEINEGDIKSQLIDEFLDQKCKIASICFRLLKRRASILSLASRLAVISFIFLILSLPRLVATVWYVKNLSNK